MKMIPRFSVIIPVYRVEAYLEQCIESLIIQDYSNVEILLIDDGSYDFCAEICDFLAIKDKRIQVVHHSNGGIVNARQTGCLVASGDFILNVDGDDWVVNNYFKVLDDIVEEYHPDCICFGFESNNTNHLYTIPNGFYDRTKIEKDIFPILIEGKNGKNFSPSIWSKAVKREIYSLIQMALNPHIVIGEDNACSKPALFKAKSIYVSDRILYCYRVNDLSITKEKKPFPWSGPELVGRNLEQQITDVNGDFQQQISRMVVHYLFGVAISQFYKGATYSNIKKDICYNLNNTYYKLAIHKAHYNVLGWREILARLILKFKLVFLLKIISSIK